MNTPGDEQDSPYRAQAIASGNAAIYQAGGNITVVQGGGRGRATVVPEQDAVACPYPGLAAFDAEHAQWFFGRKTLTSDLLERLDERLVSGGALVVIAPSGAGKSSLLRAGLLPAIAGGLLPAAGSARWPRVLMTPTDRPLAALAAALEVATGAGTRRVARALADGPAAGAAMLRGSPGTASGDDRRCVVVVDQLEELFTQCPDERERRDFLDLVCGIADPGPAGQRPAALVVLGLRSDFYTPCVGHPRLRAALQDGPLVVGHLSEEGVREAIVCPAEAVGLAVGPGLVEILLRDLGMPAPSDPADGHAGGSGRDGYEAGRLPLLAHALRAVWQQQENRTLTVDGYRDTGGIAHAVATTAERRFAELDPAGRQAARSVLLRLVKVGDGVGDTRRRVPYDTLLGRVGDRAAAEAVVTSFTLHRLLTGEGDSVEITHEVLLHAWPRLRRWIEADRAGNLLRQELEEAATDWDLAGRDAGLLYRGSRLEAAHAWAGTSREETPSPAARAFLAASVRQRRRVATLRRAVIAVLAVLALIASGAAVVAFQQRSTARTERDAAVFNQIMAEADRLRGTQLPVAAQLDLVAYRRRPAADPLTHLLADANATFPTTVTTSTAGVAAVAFSPHGHVLATGGNDGTPRLWDVTDPGHPTALGLLPGPRTDRVYSLAFSPDGRTLAGAGPDRTVHLWDVTDPAHPTTPGRPLTGPTGAVDTLAFSPDGHTLAGGGHDEKVRLWHVAGPARATALGHPLTGPTNTVSSVAFSPDGRTLAGASRDEKVRLWNVTDPAHATALGRPLTGHDSAVESVAFSPDSRTLASGGGDGNVRLWDVRHPASAAPLGAPLVGNRSTVYAVAFSPDGHTVASGGDDGTVRQWDVSNPARVPALGDPLTGHTSAVYSVAFSPDGSTLASAGLDRTVRLWRRPPTVLTGPTDAVGAVAFAPGGRTLVAAADDHTVRSWDVADPRRPTPLWRPLLRAAGPVDAAAFSPDGRVLATAGEDRAVRLWNLADPARPVPLGHLPAGRTGTVWSLAFSPDGRTLASAGPGRTVRLWNVADPAGPVPEGRPLTGNYDAVRSVAFSPDGRLLASGGADGAVRIWDVSHPARPVGLFTIGFTNGVLAVAFSPDSRTLAAAGYDQQVSLWHVAGTARPTPLGHPLAGHSDAVWSLAFSPDGRTLASAGDDHTVRLWPLDPAWAARRVCAATALIRARWHTYLPGLPYAPPCA